jgi:SET domain
MSPSLETQTLLNGATPAFQTKAINSNGVATGNNHRKIATDVDDLKDRLHVERSPKAFGSRAVSLIDLPAGSLFLKITKATPATKAYTSVQTSENTHIELNSDIVFINHSCKPSVVFDMEKMEVRVSADRDLKKNDGLTFFYPSSEWAMAQPFDCTCGEKECQGIIDGAGNMSEEVVRGYWLNKHIERLLSAKSGREGGNGIGIKNGN